MNVIVKYKTGNEITLKNVTAIKKDEEDENVLFGFVIHDIYHDTPIECKELESIIVTKF